MNLRLGIAILLLVGLFSAGPLSVAQEGGACPALVDAALGAVGDRCAGLARNEACYGNHRVDAVFWTDPLAFSAPADRAPLDDLHTLATAPLDPERDQWGIAVLSVQANLPEALPGQNVTFLLMGDASLENAARPDAAARTARGVAIAAGNLRSRPTMNTTIVGAVAAGDVLRLVGVNAAGDWYEVALDGGGTAWIWGELVQAGYTYGLAVTEDASAGADGAARPGPMQAFTLTTGLGGLACDEAPDALLIQNPTGTAVSLRINAMEVTLGSTVVFSTVALPDGGRALVGLLVEGEMTARTETFTVRLSGAGDYVAARLDGAGQIAADAEPVDLGESGDLIGHVQALAQVACAHSSASGVLEPVGGDCAIEPGFVPAQAVPEPSASATSLSLVNATDACTVAGINVVNLRGGPGTTYPRQGQMAAGQTAHPDGYALGAGGFRWWRLEGGAWLRGDLVETAGACAAIAAVTPPEPPSQPVAPSSQGGNLTTHLPVTYCSVSAGGVSPWRHPANTPLTLQGARPGASEELARNSAAYITTSLILDGVSLGEGSRFVDMVNCTGPACFRVNWTTPPLAPGQHTAQVIYTLLQRWSWGADPNQYAEAGTVDSSDMCVFTTE